MRRRPGADPDRMATRVMARGNGHPPRAMALLCKAQESDYGGGRQADRIMFQTRHVAAMIAALTTSALVPSALAQSPPRVSVLLCTNPASGMTWQISIDYDHATVDTNPAKISDDEIVWRDAKDLWNYTMDRKTGKLTVVVASSTGGYFLHDTCKLPP